MIKFISNNDYFDENGQLQYTGYGSSQEKINSYGKSPVEKIFPFLVNLFKPNKD
ncbi:hypothetical protein Ga0466249_002281 [Sporomusaceae bacterium BoRhaA]|uniref:hypothetical protein n=1 Tax=Pelorhabdus rhamnosifermentans TaxID=2772457 RepID=UPI001C061965|nr:hypothetical protein [Pelorhabdus rhamnosifermentans]MBU2701167.1 hypothetical protein [Pelorhabdus rhamnosifermentans]